MVFHWSRRDSKSPQVSRTLLGIPADLTTGAVRMVLIRPPISNSSSPFSKLLETVSSKPITIAIITLIWNILLLLQLLFTH